MVRARRLDRPARARNTPRVPASTLPDRIPDGAATSTVRYRVPFYDTDGMRIVHHANYVRYLELARVGFLEEHATAYERLVARGMHFAVTRCEVRYRQAARFADDLAITCWLDWVKGVSLGIGYLVARDGERLASARTEHAMVDEAGRLLRMPDEQRAALARLVAR